LITIKSLTVRNFLSVGQNTQAINLAASGLTLVLGKNADIGAANSRNGCGKTTVAQAICYALFGEPLANIRVNNLINNINQKSMLVTIEFERDGKTYRIERGRKPNLLRFFVNDKPLKDGSKDSLKDSSNDESDEAQGENKHTQAEIDRILGMSYLLFKHLVTLNTITEPFLRMKPAQQREVIEELLGITQISLRDEVLQKQIKSTKEIIRDEEAAVKATIEANSRIERAIARAKEDRFSWDMAQQAKIAGLLRQIDDISHIDFDAEIEIFDLIDEWVAAERELNTARALYVSETESIAKESRNLTSEIKRQRETVGMNFETQIARLEAEVRRCETEAAKTPDTQIARLQGDIDRREKECAAKTKAGQAKETELEAVCSEMESADGHTCSTCGQGLEGTDHLAKVIKALTAKAELLGAEVMRCYSDAETLQDEAVQIRKEIEQIKEGWAAKQSEWLDKASSIRIEIGLIENQREEQDAANAAKIVELENDLTVVQQLLTEREIGLQEIDDAILALGSRPVSGYRNREEVWRIRQAKESFLADVEREKIAQNPHDSYIASLEATLQVIDYTALNDAQNLLKHQDFLHKLLSGKDSFIRKKIIDQNLNYLNGRMNKYLEALGLPHEVRFKPDLSVDISMLGREFDFEQLSRGEMNRVVLATSWSFRDVWESTNTSLNLCIVDELIDSGMDDNGAESALEVLNKMARERGKNVFLISHKESLIGRVNRILMIHKENQFTRFEEDAEF